MRSRHLTVQKKLHFFSNKTRLTSIEQHLVFKVLFLQVLHKGDHFVDDRIQHWLEAKQTLLVSATAEKLMKNPTEALGLYTKV